MNFEMVVTEHDLRTRFEGERDLVTYAPYRVGDRVVRCRDCRAVIKTEFISGSCPLCGHAPFQPSPVDASYSFHTPSEVPRVVPGTAPHSRQTDNALWLLLLSVATTLIPFCFPDAASFIMRASFGMDLKTCILCAVILSGICAVILFFCRRNSSAWPSSRAGNLLFLLPTAVPYGILAALWAVIAVVAIVVVIGCIAIVIGIISGMCD